MDAVVGHPQTNPNRARLRPPSSGKLLALGRCGLPFSPGGLPEALVGLGSPVHTDAMTHALMP